MKENGVSLLWWNRVKEEGLFSILGKLVFLLLIYGLLLVLILEKEGRGVDWIFARIPLLAVVRDVSAVGQYIFWLVSLWLGFQIGNQVGMKRGAARERHRMGVI